ncbi:hypothetical protein LIG30_0582 [Burkholderia sp. lig30]|nr:hypothetical protein [Burkholderia sp. lig30]KDB10536.1 hypothetical protein LIG30_0582 [Burkholderia sp. lig30]
MSNAWRWIGIGVAACAAGWSLPAAADVKIGVTLSATGPAASLGIPEKNTIALNTAQPGTPAFRDALPRGLEPGRDVAASHGVFNLSATDHAGLDERASGMVQIVDGRWQWVR